MLSFFSKCIILWFKEKSFQVTVDNQLSEPVAVNINKGSIQNIESYSANVNVYSGNNRDVYGIREAQKYRISFKEIEGIYHFKIDRSGDSYSDGIARSILHNGQELFIFKTDSNELEHRIDANMEQSLGSGLPFESDSQLPIIARIPNFNSLRMQMYDIAYDLTENNFTLQMKLPTDLYDDFTLSFDLEKESLSETSTVKVLEDSTIVTNTTEYLYQEVDGTLLKIGNIQNIEYDI